MIPIRLNLLSPPKRRFHREAVYFQFTKNFLEVCLVVVCACTSAIVIGSATLQNASERMIARQTIADSRYTKYSQQVERINKRLDRMTMITKQVIPWQTLIPELTNALPPHISLDTLTIDMHGRSLTINGTAPTREDLLALATALETVPWIQGPITLSPSSLTQRDDIRFSLPVTLK